MTGMDLMLERIAGHFCPDGTQWYKTLPVKNDRHGTECVKME